MNADTLLVGSFPGDGLPKPIAFPVPETVSELHDDGIPCVGLRTLLEQKLACGMSTTHRMQDFADVVQPIRVNSLPADFASQLNPRVADK